MRIPGHVTGSTGAFLVQGLLLVLLAGLFPGNLHAAPAAEQHVVFMLDRSKSMREVDGEKCGPKFKKQMADVRAKARGLLREMDARRKPVDVAFWRFGERGNLAKIADAMTPAQAVERVDELFADDCDTYDQDWTYMAHSMFELVRAHVPGGRLTTDDSIPPETGLFYIYVFTDGEESVPRTDKAFNQPYVDWLKKVTDGLQLLWYKWFVNDEGVEPPPELPERVFQVILGNVTDAASINPETMSGDGRLSLDLPRTIRLAPALFSSGSELRCEPAPSAGGEAVGNRRLAVQGHVEWRVPSSTGYTGEWAIAVSSEPFDGTAVLRATIEGPTEVVVPSVNIPDGTIPVRLDKESLCRELNRMAPDVTWLLPREGDDAPGLQIKRLGNIIVSRVPTLTFPVTTQEGVPADADLQALEADRFGIHAPVGRTFRVGSPTEKVVPVDLSIQVRGADGSAVPDAEDIVRLVVAGGDESPSGASLSVGTGMDVRLRLPAEDHGRLGGLLYLGFRPEPGDYSLSLCVTPKVPSDPDHTVRIHVACPGCASGAVQREDDGGPQCIRIPVTIKARPFTWLEIAIALILLAIATYLFLRWVTRPRFPAGLRIGNPKGGEDMRSIHEGGAKGMMAVYHRKPLYVSLHPNGTTVYWLDPFGGPAGSGRSGGGRTAVNMVGVRPGSLGRPSMMVWCRSASVADGETTISVDGRSLLPTDSVPKPTDARFVVRVRYGDVGRGTRKIVVRRVHRSPTSDALEVEETVYPISIEGKTKRMK